LSTGFSGSIFINISEKVFDFIFTSFFPPPPLPVHEQSEKKTGKLAKKSEKKAKKVKK
jgi:hypothetical protein